MTRYDEFRPFRLRGHARPATRALHRAGTSLVFACLAAGPATGRRWLSRAMPVAGQGFARAAHFAVGRNRPATFRHPLWSLASDFRMYGLWITGRLGPEPAKAGVPAR